MCIAIDIQTIVAFKIRGIYVSVTDLGPGGVRLPAAYSRCNAKHKHNGKQ